jgi:hypothetical protein
VVRTSTAWLRPERTRHAQGLALMLEGQAVARLDLQRGHALGLQRLQALAALRLQLRFTRGACGFHRRGDAATGARNVFITGALQPQFEFVRAVAAIHQMRVAIDQARA